MAARGWAGSIITAVGVAAGASAAQLGLGYGLGIIVWVPAEQQITKSVWLASLAWVLWLAATSTVVGAVCADRLGTRPGESIMDSKGRGRLAAVVDSAWRVVTALAAAIGALVTVALVVVPADAAPRAETTFAPGITAAQYAAIGVTLGLFVAIAALNSRAVTANVFASMAWLWTLAVVAIVDRAYRGGVPGSPAECGATACHPSTAPLGIWRFTEGPLPRDLYLPGALLMLVAALLVGALAAWPASRQGRNPIGVAISGAVAPGLVAAAYLLVTTNLLGLPAQQRTTFIVAPYAVIAGLAGSVLVAMIGQRARRGPRTEEIDPAETDWTAALSNVDERAGGTANGTDLVPAGAPAKGTASVTAGSGATGGAGTDSRAVELADDSYAPPRAYPSDAAASAYATDSDGIDSGGADAPAAGTAKPATATGRASVAEPLWPEAPKPATGPTPEPKGKGGRPGRRR